MHTVLLQTSKAPKGRSESFLQSPESCSRRIIKPFNFLRLHIKLVIFSHSFTIKQGPWTEKSPTCLFSLTQTYLLGPTHDFLWIWSLRPTLTTYSRKLSSNFPPKNPVSACLKSFLTFHWTRKLSCPCLGETAKSLHYVVMCVHTVVKRNIFSFKTCICKGKEITTSHTHTWLLFTWILDPNSGNQVNSLRYLVILHHYNILMLEIDHFPKRKRKII